MVQVEDIGDSKQIRKMQLPALISVTKNINYPELPKLDRKLESLKIDINKIGFIDLEGFLSEEETGFKGSPTKISKIRVPKVEERSSKLYKEDSLGFLTEMTTRLRDKKII